MANIVQCPECQKSLKLSDAVAGKRVRCPGCKHSFVAPADEEIDEVLPADEEAPPKRSRPAREEDEDEDDDAPRRPRKRKRRDQDIPAPILPMIYGVLSLVLCCASPLALLLGWAAVSRADWAMGELPDNSRAEAAYSNLRLARMLGVIGMCLNGALIVIAVIYNIAIRLRH